MENDVMLRLDKYLADMGAGTRAEVKNLIRKGRVQVDGVVCRQPEQKVEPATTEVMLDGEMIGYQKFYYYMMYKPAGVVTAREDGRDRTVMDVMRKWMESAGVECPVFDDLSPVGRLDKDTEGLLLITNDGALSHQLLAPGKHVDKVYYARVRGEMTEIDVKRFAEGITFAEFTSMPAELLIDRAEAGISEVRIRIKEGKFHQVKRMVHVVGKEVVYLKRLSMGSLELDPELEPGMCRELTLQEVESLGGNT